MTTEENTSIRGENAYGQVEPPFRWDLKSPITCAVSLPANRVDELAEFLAGLGVPMDPKLQIFAVNPDLLDPVSFTGEDVPRMVEGINDHLYSRNIQPLIPENHQEWSVRRRHALLTMAAHHFFWVRQHRGPQSLWDKISPEDWQDLTKEYALVFGKETS